jgi:iron complex outermembrane receptor protein
MTHTTTMRRRSVLALSIAAALLAGSAMAQEEGSAEGNDEQRASGQLETITVTAQRREEDVQRVPIAITPLAGEKLAVFGSAGDDIRFLSGRLPSLLIESSFGRSFPRFYIRGLGNTDFDLNSSQPVSLVYDDIVLENPMLKGQPVFDLDRIEMLRGPQGTLFGRNTPAGVLKFESARPTREAEGYGKIAYGTYNTVNAEAAISGPLTETLSARGSFLLQRRNDWVDNTFTGEDDALEGYQEIGGRLQFLHEGENFNGLLKLHVRDLEGTARLFRANAIERGGNGRVAGFDIEEVAIDGDNFQDLQAWGASLKLDWDLGSMNLYSITGYETLEFLGRGDIDGGFGAVFAPPSGPGLIPFTAETADGIPDHDQVTQEFRLESDDWGVFDWQAGFFYFTEDLSVDTFNYDTLAPRRPQNGYARQEQENDAWAVYASGEYDINEQLVLRGGLRYTDDEKEFVAFRTQSPLAFLGVGPLPPTFAESDESDVSWDASLTYAFDEDTNVFARVAKGFRAPSIQGRVLFGDAVSVADSEEVVSVEAGIKVDLWDRRARIGATVYSYRIDDQQLTAVGGATNFNTLINAEQTDGQGFEFDAEAYVTENFLVTAGFSYNDTEIDDPNLFIQPCGGGCTVLDPRGRVAGTVSIDGNRLPQAPERVANLTARYGIPMGAGSEFFIYTDWAYRSEVSFFLYESKEFTGDPLLEGGLRLGYNWNYGQYEIAAYGRNILDEVEFVGGIDFNNLTGFVNEPRIIGVEFSARF